MTRPRPSAELLESPWLIPKPGMEVWDWIVREILADTGSIRNPGRAHLIDANIGVVWASMGFANPADPFS